MKFMAILLLLQMNQTAPGPSLSLPSIFSENMVLQQHVEAPFWGHAKPGREVTITATWGRSVRTFVTKEGSWMTKLRTPRAGGPYEIIIQSDESQIVYRNVLVGEVWLCAGQSNMELPLAGEPPAIPVKNSEEAAKNARSPRCDFLKSAGHCQSPLNTIVREDGRNVIRCQRVPVQCHGIFLRTFSLQHIKGAGRLDTVELGWHAGSGLDKREVSQRSLNAWADPEQVIDSNRDDIIRQTRWMRMNSVIDVSRKPPSTRWENLEFDDEECSRPDYSDENWEIDESSYLVGANSHSVNLTELFGSGKRFRFRDNGFRAIWSYRWGPLTMWTGHTSTAYSLAKQKRKNNGARPPYLQCPERYCYGFDLYSRGQSD